MKHKEALQKAKHALEEARAGGLQNLQSEKVREEGCTPCLYLQHHSHPSRGSNAKKLIVLYAHLHVMAPDSPQARRKFHIITSINWG